MCWADFDNFWTDFGQCWPNVLNWGYTQVFEYARVFGSPTATTYRRLDPQPRLHTGVWIPSRSYTQVFGVSTAATHRCLESQPRLHTGVWSPNRGYTRVSGVANRGYIRVFESQTVDPASCHFGSCASNPHRFQFLRFSVSSIGAVS